jgi:tetratricopeptide (TPR) repeat protein
MPELKDAKNLIASGKYREASKILDRMLIEKESDEIWYLRGLVSLKLKNYDAALESFERALYINKKALYFRMKGVARMERFELEQAIGDFGEALKMDSDDLLSNFYMAVCYMFLDDPKSSAYLKRAFFIDKERTKNMLKDFYIMFFRQDPLIGKAIKEDLARRIDKIKTN